MGTDEIKGMKEAEHRAKECGETLSHALLDRMHANVLLSEHACRAQVRLWAWRRPSTEPRDMRIWA